AGPLRSLGQATAAVVAAGADGAVAERSRRFRHPSVPDAAAVSSPTRPSSDLVGDRRRAMVGDAAAVGGGVAAHGAAAVGERGLQTVPDAAAVDNGRVAVDGAVGDGEFPPVGVEDTTTGVTGRPAAAGAIGDRG